MFRWLAMLVALLVISGCGATRVIRNDPGGRIIDYALKVAKAKSVRIDGWCASACTLYIAHPNVCITRRARLAFHAASHPVATQYLINQYPQWVDDWIAAQGGLSARLVEMPNRHAMQHMRAC